MIYPHIIYHIVNFKIVRESVTKFLGIFINENLTWKYHVEHVCNKVSKSIEIMCKSRNSLGKRLMKQLYFSFIHSYPDYANMARASINKSNLISLYRHQKHAIRIIYDKDRFAHAKCLSKHVKALTVYEINLFHSFDSSVLPRSVPSESSILSSYIIIYNSYKHLSK